MAEFLPPFLALYCYYFFNGTLRKHSSLQQDFKTFHPRVLLELVRFYYLHLNLRFIENLS